MNTKEERTAGGRRDAWKRREGTYTERQIQAPIAYHGTQTLFVLWLITSQLFVYMHHNNGVGLGLDYQ